MVFTKSYSPTLNEYLSSGWAKGYNSEVALLSGILLAQKHSRGLSALGPTALVRSNALVRVPAQKKYALNSGLLLSGISLYSYHEAQHIRITTGDVYSRSVHVKF